MLIHLVKIWHPFCRYFSWIPYKKRNQKTILRDPSYQTVRGSLDHLANSLSPLTHKFFTGCPHPRSILYGNWKVRVSTTRKTRRHYSTNPKKNNILKEILQNYHILLLSDPPKRVIESAGFSGTPNDMVSLSHTKPHNISLKEMESHEKWPLFWVPLTVSHVPPRQWPATFLLCTWFL